MHEEMKELIRKKDMGVLATVSGNLPHCSLMAYVTDQECREVIMVTLRESTKFKNLIRNPRVSFLIDTREEHPPPGRSEASALTVSGLFQRFEDQALLDAARKRLLEKHPQLKALLDHPDAEIFRIRMLSMLFLKGVSDAYFAEVERERPFDGV